MSDDVVITTDHGLRTISFNRPARKNALTVAMYTAAVEALQSARTDDGVRVVLFTGTGDAFTSGNDVKDFSTWFSAPDGAAGCSHG